MYGTIIAWPTIMCKPLLTKTNKFTVDKQNMHYVNDYNFTEVAECCFKTENSSVVLDIIICMVTILSYYFRIQYEN